MPPLISVITPSYNQGEFIEENILSIISQEYPNIEHIVVDGGSTDNTVDILKKYENEYNLRWISESDRGQSHAVNKGIEMANGSWIGWQNSDDYYLPGAFKKFQSVIERKPDTDVIYGDVLIVDKNGNEINRKFNTRNSKYVQKHWSVFANNQSLLLHEDVFSKVGMVKENLEYTMDSELMWRILKSDFVFENIPDVLGAFRKHEMAKTIDSNRGVHPELNNVYDYSPIEKLVPNRITEGSAKMLKLCDLIRDQRWDALRYNIQRKVTNY